MFTPRFVDMLIQHPNAVAQWYHDRGYNFLILSEHNKFIDPSTVQLKGEVRK
jgi:hypothetical protein